MTALSIYDPFADVFPSLFRSLFNEPANQVARREIVRPTVSNLVSSFALDVHEDDKAYSVVANLPGVAKENISVEIDGNQISIRAERKIERPAIDNQASDAAQAEKVAKVLRTERFSGSYARSFSLPQDIDDAAASAKYENGVLTLGLPKKAQVSAKRLTIA